MFRKAVISLIKKKNPHFTMHNSIGFGVLLQLVFSKGMAWLRSLKLLFRLRMPKLLFLGKNVQFFNLTNIQLGKWVQLEDHVVLSGLSKRPLVLGNNVRIGAFSRVIASTSFSNPGVGIQIGNNVGIGEFAYLGGAGGLEIGDDCIIGQYLSCHPENHNFADNNELIRLQGVSQKGIKIGTNCWIGSKVTILDGVEIGENSVIAAGAVITKSMPANSIIGGVPARMIKSRLPASASADPYMIAS